MTDAPSRGSSGARAALALPGLAAVFAAAVFAQGGFHDRRLTPIAIVAAVVALASASRAVLRPWHAPAAFAALGTGLLVSGAANGFPSGGAKPALTLLLCASAYTLAHRATVRDGFEQVADALTIVVCLVAVLGIAGVAFHLRTFAFEAGSWRLSSTLTYQNAAAALFAIGLPVALARADRPGQRAAAVVAGVALAATQSRGGAVAGLAAIGVVAAGRGVPSPARLFVGWAIATTSLLPAIAGIAASGVVAVAGIPLGMLVAARAPVRPSGVPRAAVVAGVSAAAVALTVAALATPAGDRFSLTPNDRDRVWSKTAEMIGDRPAFGSGPGTYALVDRVNDVSIRTMHAHNEYLQAAAETGLAGLALVLLAIALLATAVRRSPAPGPRTVAIAAGVALLVHSAFDFLWRIPALPALAFALAAAAIASPVRDP